MAIFSSKKGTVARTTSAQTRQIHGYHFRHMSSSLTLPAMYLAIAAAAQRTTSSESRPPLSSHSKNPAGVARPEGSVTVEDRKPWL